MFSRILIATDLSAASHAVVQCAAGLRSVGAKECYLLQCMNLSEAASAIAVQAKEVLEQGLLDQKGVLERAGLTVHTQVVPGFAQVEINRVAREKDCSLIVVGSHGHTLLGEMMLGGVASAVIHHAVKPVLIIRVVRSRDSSDVCVEGEKCDFLRHILFPTDFSENARHAFNAVKHMVAAGAQAVTLCHVQDKSRIDPHLMDRLEEFNRIDQERLAKMKDELAEAGSAQVQTHVCFGLPAQQILRTIAEQKPTLVVMGSQGRGFISEIFLGSVSHAVARHSPAPVLLIPVPR